MVQWSVVPFGKSKKPPFRSEQLKYLRKINLIQFSLNLSIAHFVEAKENNIETTEDYSLVITSN